MIAAWFYYLTGSLLPGLLFQMSCALGGWLIFNLYPRLFTLLGFLF
ncbi:MAG: hypothetical protein GWM98_11460 [Nitrospinaceae bacterium]|nr:hypothetical protein [Nitrospinaceae bacterium]NIR55002.1 hypothetical protein [Nitrospinaceae bacterium]NIT82242.1 hypothetical protein [Nitrospinaceae bacterium]NIX34627.1 hypothetical protein [Nitrospinaceae bacterium]NIY15459.1 hypothetical protein [Nitrospinaceae bacterium]